MLTKTYTRRPLPELTDAELRLLLEEAKDFDDEKTCSLARAALKGSMRARAACARIIDASRGTSC